MKRVYLPLACLLSAAALGGCQSTLGTISSTAANISANAPTACADLANAGALASSIANQVAAANPNNAKILSVVAKIQNGVRLTSTDCVNYSKVVQAANGAVQVGVAATAATGK